jgi:hypothetical protein
MSYRQLQQPTYPFVVVVLGSLLQSIKAKRSPLEPLHNSGRTVAPCFITDNGSHCSFQFSTGRNQATVTTAHEVTHADTTTATHCKFSSRNAHLTKSTTA